ncbi:DUF2171 domain-containing protein [Roseicella frigidaeris]|uniref:DUF2171 domain-containing protein n=1 Tax=Roseicella frigidaeris TaxID=2230885 RepID=A0A327M5F7_9PROT|nr:DUF2171 domain-containing protein [Roseicella frigidaeris]RAI55288.1 hypothetical protein DOO78_24525 [Roseicella frigidaeris]
MEEMAIEPGMPVIGSDDHPVGRVEHRDGTYLKLARSEAASGGRYRWLPLALVAGIEAGGLRLSVTAADAAAAALDEDEAQRRMALDPDGRREFGQPDDGGPQAGRA